MKKIILTLILCLSLLCNTGCTLILISSLLGSNDSETVTDAGKYGSFHDDVEIPSYYPETLSGYTVNDYFYTVDKSTTLCYEIYLDITVTEEAFTTVIAKVNADDRAKTVKSAYHSASYTDVIFSDEIDLALDGYIDKIESAKVEKVIYNEAESRIIFALLYVEELSYYSSDKVQYFKKLNIDLEKYLSQKNNEF